MQQEDEVLLSAIARLRREANGRLVAELEQKQNAAGSSLEWYEITKTVLEGFSTSQPLSNETRSELERAIQAASAMIKITVEYMSHCNRCSGSVDEIPSDGTDGLCRDCWKEWLREKYGPGMPHTVRLRKIGIPPRVYDFFRSCEEYCLMECCGLNALDLSPESISSLFSGLSQEDRREFLAQFDEWLKAVSENQLPLTVLGDKYTVDEFNTMVGPVKDALARFRGVAKS
jgi:hypothetical protein